MSGEPATKRQKFVKNKKRFYLPSSRRSYLEVGQRGFLATCNFYEKECVRECYNILNQYADELYGPEERTPDVSTEGHEGGDTESPPRDVGGDDIADELQKQIEASQQRAKGAVARRFQAVDTGATNCIFIKTTLADPVALGSHIVEDIAEKREQKTRFLLRLLPIEAVCKANNKDIIDAAGLICDKYFLKEATTFSIVFNRRFNTGLKKETLIRELAELVHSKNVGNKVDLKHAQRSLLVEVVKGLCCLTVLKNYTQFRKYNLIELARAESSEHNMDDEKSVVAEDRSTEKLTSDDE